MHYNRIDQRAGLWFSSHCFEKFAIQLIEQLAGRLVLTACKCATSDQSSWQDSLVLTALPFRWAAGRTPRPHSLLTIDHRAAAGRSV